MSTHGEGSFREGTAELGVKENVENNIFRLCIYIYSCVYIHT